MSYYASLNGSRVVSATIQLPFYGTWTADVTLAIDTALASEDTLIVGALSLQGNVVRVFDFGGSRTCRMVGGFGGWQKTIPAKAYRNPAGVPVAVVLNDAALECGEQWGANELSTYAQGNVGQAYVRETAPAQRTLASLAGSLWWVDGTGVTRLAPRSNAAITSQFDAIKYTGGRGRWEIASEHPEDWLPGRTFSSPVITSTQTISLSALQVDNDGKLRVVVLTTP